MVQTNTKYLCPDKHSLHRCVCIWSAQSGHLFHHHLDDDLCRQGDCLRYALRVLCALPSVLLRHWPPYFHPLPQQHQGWARGGHHPGCKVCLGAWPPKAKHPHFPHRLSCLPCGLPMEPCGLCCPKGLWKTLHLGLLHQIGEWKELFWGIHYWWLSILYPCWGTLHWFLVLVQLKWGYAVGESSNLKYLFSLK